MSKKNRIRLADVLAMFKNKESDRWFWLRDYLWHLLWPLFALALMSAGLTLLAFTLGSAFGAGLASQLKGAGIEFDLILQVP